MISSSKGFAKFQRKLDGKVHVDPPILLDIEDWHTLSVLAGERYSSGRYNEQAEFFCSFLDCLDTTATKYSDSFFKARRTNFVSKELLENILEIHKLYADYYSRH